MHFFFDLAKAFDSLNHKVLLEKLECVGIRGNINRWFKSYLESRSVRVKIDGTFSDEFSVCLGVPQGSVLGPLAFLLFINDLPDHITEGQVFMYADDTTILVTAADAEHLTYKLLTVIKEFDAWCNNNQLIINYDKTQYIEFCHNYNTNTLNDNICYNNVDILSKYSAKFLGLVVDMHLSWRQHLDGVALKLNKCCYLIRNLRTTLDSESLLRVYYGIVYPVLSYMIVTWGQACASNGLQRIFVIQKRIIRLIYGLHSRTSCRDVFKENGILTVTSIYLYKLLVHTHITYDSNENVSTSGSIHNYNVRRPNNLRTTFPRSEAFKKSPVYAGSIYYNKLPIHIRECQTPTLFKKELKTFLVNKTIYTLAEF